MSGFYSGFFVGWVGIIINRALYLALFDSARTYLHQGENEPPLWKKWVIAQGVTILAGIAVYPFANIRYQLIISQLENSKKKYSGTIDCARRIYDEEGFLGFFDGAVGNMVSGLIGPVVLLFYEFSKVIRKG